ncbi:MAG TPA: DEAD/DEAH box helicase [Alphaproteobacteria bacterium]|nr:DEAD/DEAH box helicase [Alphaproteobacteria bacterium]
MTTFTPFGLPTFINESLEKMGITTPTPIQGKAIPPALEGHDILASAQTGTGKTMAYLIPVITNLLNAPQSTALILAPTRELAAQIQTAARALLGKKIEVALLIGGESMYKQLSALKRHPRIIIGTPGRIIDHLNRRTLKLVEARFLVLDETDRMLDMGFTEALKKIVQNLPKERQTFMFSATMPPSIKTLSLTYLTNPQHISVGSTNEPVLKIKQETLQTSNNEKFPCLIKELDEREGSVIIFVKTKHGADRLAEKLSSQNHHAAAMHGDLKQRKREEVLRNFLHLKKRIMVATDIAARGLDIPHIKHVINYDLPQCPEDYIHRIGRTGRAGMEGSALSLISPEDNIKWRRIHQLLNPGQAQPHSSSENKPRRRSKPRPFQNSSASKHGPSKHAGPKPTDSKRGAPKRGFSKRGSSQREHGFR